MTILPSVSRRTLLGAGLGLAATAALPLRGVLAQNDIIRRAIPKTGEMVPALGLGTFLTFDLLPGAPRDHLEQVARTYLDAGVRVIDTSPLYGSAETSTGDFLAETGMADQVFIANKIWSTGEFLGDESHALQSLSQSQNRLWREKIDLLQCHSLVNVDAVVPLLKAWKKEGRVRYFGVTHFQNNHHDLLLEWIAKGDLDFVQVNYSIINRGAERVLEAARERNVAVITNMPLEKARLHQALGEAKLPDFAREIGAESWAEYFLKWVISHPAVTTALCATADPAHAAQNVRALRGELPDRELRERMARHIEGLSGISEVTRKPWYPGKKYAGQISRAQADVRARS